MFYEKYVDLCRKNGYSPTGLARRIGISSRTAADWAFGSMPRPATLKKIADFFGVDVSYFDDDYEGLTDTIEHTPLVQGLIEQIARNIDDDEKLLLDMYRSMTETQKADLLKEAMRIKLR